MLMSNFKVADMESKLREAHARERVTLELAEELAIARSRGHELSKLLSEQVRRDYAPI
jgi:hypothetical protein